MFIDQQNLIRALLCRRTRRATVQAVAFSAGSFLVLRAVSSGGAPLAGAHENDDGDDDNSGRGRDGDRGGEADDNRGPGNDHEPEDEERPIAEVPAGSIEVRIVSDDAGAFVPSELTINAGQSVTFVNAHSDEHTATGSGFDTGIIPEGGLATVVLETPGTFAYACQIHPVMTGTIRVRGEDGTVPTQASATPAPTAGDAAVSIVNLAFDPAEFAVPAGTTVNWTNDDTVPHTVTSLDGVFDSGILDPGARFSWAFDQPGMFAYQCQLHPQMRGTVNVEREEASATPTQIAASP